MANLRWRPVGCLYSTQGPDDDVHEVLGHRLSLRFVVNNEVGLSEDGIELPLCSEALALVRILHLSFLQHVVEEEDE